MNTSIYFDKETLQHLDAWARSKRISRSDAVRFCVRTYLESIRFEI